MSQPIELGMFCIFLGPGDGKGLKHRVIETTMKYVITWSQYKVGDVLTPGYSWMGPRPDFCTHFRPCFPEEL